jgi:ABC-type transporter Mla maintaining outer membrane lipid asymmetry ATPase subunit MlaF
MTMSEPLIHMRDIHKSYGPVTALAGVDFAVHPNEIVGLLGTPGFRADILMTAQRVAITFLISVVLGAVQVVVGVARTTF